MTVVSKTSLIHPEMSLPESGKSSDAMWDFLSIRYRKTTTNDRNDSVDNNELCLIKQTPKEKKSIAMPPNDTTVEGSLSQELMKLSMNDRTAIEEDIHGVSSTPGETPEFLAWRLHEFDKELMNAKNCPKRRRKLERNRGARNNNGEGEPGIAEEDDVLRNVIRLTPHHVEDMEEVSTISTVSTEASMDIRAVTPPNIPSGQTIAEHESKKACYVNDPNVRLRFLRAESYDSKKAVNRFISFLVYSQELYGNFVADRPIRLSDLKTRKEKRTLANIAFHFLPFRDRSGRRVFVSVGPCGYDIEPMLRIKILWYMFWIASEDVESQRKGVVIVGWPNNSKVDACMTKACDSDSGESIDPWEQLRPTLINLEGAYQAKAMVGLPMRVAAVHVCHEDKPVFNIVNALFYFAMGPAIKSRYKVHIGKSKTVNHCLNCVRLFLCTLFMLI